MPPPSRVAVAAVPPAVVTRRPGVVPRRVPLKVGRAQGPLPGPLKRGEVLPQVPPRALQGPEPLAESKGDRPQPRVLAQDSRGWDKR